MQPSIAPLEALVSGYEEQIATLHEEAAFQLAEASIASFREGRRSAGVTFARSALAHAGGAKQISRTLLSALELMQKQQENVAPRKTRQKKTT